MNKGTLSKDDINTEKIDLEDLLIIQNPKQYLYAYKHFASAQKGAAIMLITKELF